ncbi:MAG: class I SAM-dependent methyltransferase [Bacteroidota bacterium]
MNPIHQANQKRWEASAANWAKAADSRGIWKACVNDPSLVFSERVLHYLKGIKGEKVAVLGSGDNQAVFALAGMGAAVTSVDISANQLKYAADRAEALGQSIQFIQSDVTNLSALADEQFDLVYTGGHVAVWVADLQKYYAEASRILRPGGLFIVDEYHPFRRVWKSSKNELVVGYPYFERGPFRFMYNDDVLYHQEGNLESYEHHWSVSDFFNAIIKSGCSIVEVDEYGTSSEDWEEAPMEGLPEILLIVGRKTAS